MPQELSATLTLQEHQARADAAFNLGPGYPQVPLPDSMRRLLGEVADQPIGPDFSTNERYDQSSELDHRLDRGVRKFVGVTERETLRICPTFSGSVALDRAISAVQRLALDRGRKRLVVVTTSPSIDIVRHMVSERADAELFALDSRAGGIDFALDEQAVIDSIVRLTQREKDSHVVALLSSPENPSGTVWSASSLRRIGEVCSGSGATLLVDHCFVQAGVHKSADVAKIWDLAHSDLDWLAIWDTGKTFGLNEDKLGFILSGNERVSRMVDESLNVLQFDVAQRQKVMFATLLGSSNAPEWVDELRAVCLDNLSTVLRFAANSQFISVRQPQAGTFAILDLGSRIGDENARQRLMGCGVGVITGSTFFHGRWRPTQFLRIALARESSFFSTACGQLFTALEDQLG